MRVRRSVTALLAGLTACGGAELEQRQVEVAAVGAAVMPFDLDRTTHVFGPMENGGLQTIRSDDGDV